MGKNITPFVHRAFFRRNQQRAVFTLHPLTGKALHCQITLSYLRRRRLLHQRRMAHGSQRLGTGLQAERFHLAQERRNIAPQTQAGADHQKQHNQHKPSRGIHIVQAEEMINFRPERAKLHHIIRPRLILLQYRADNRRDAEYAQQRNSKPHRAEKSESRTPDQRYFLITCHEYEIFSARCENGHARVMFFTQ